MDEEEMKWIPVMLIMVEGIGLSLPCTFRYTSLPDEPKHIHWTALAQMLTDLRSYLWWCTTKYMFIKADDNIVIIIWENSENAYCLFDILYYITKMYTDVKI